MKKLLIIFGATGDLTSRFLMPALCELHAGGRLPEGFSVLGIAREEWDSTSFRSHIVQRSRPFVPQHLLSGDFLERLHYATADVSNEEAVLAALGTVREPAVFYLALPPALFTPLVRALARLAPPAGSAFVFEKPFGDTLSAARSLNLLLRQHFAEESVYRMDSFLGEQTVHNLLGLRFMNRIFSPLWSREHIERVEICWDETLTLEGRAVYYDRAGALKDMIQNHLLQLMCIVAMEAPESLAEGDFRGRKVEVLQQVRRLSAVEVRQGTVRGRYGAGQIGARQVPAYRDENGVDPARDTETFASVELFIDSERWRGVPFLLRTGKALGKDRMEIVIRFRGEPQRLFSIGGEALAHNVLRLGLNPDRISLGVNIAGRCDACPPRYVELDTDLVEQELSPYSRLLFDVFRGRQTNFVRWDEAEACWEIVEPILRGWLEGAVPLQEYPAGSDGPAQTPERS
ncbi:glucose-6-phosphate dehydrogenase [Geomonas sp. RF6]|uniref:glucose-6-phosphate dehydrogenase n=1 Tax=Geomonas sp. RF6 TaxID=2897342 RepID=UPI001E413787|nr:glucose-6-phosphate dehydrogenase [Geomonas sp. RF6]UFS70695.1 glucose-6-phosphate dehydrogenase [Geomonas sp. RF6]